MRNHLHFTIIVLFLLLTGHSFAQKRIVVMGSSTAFGDNASSYSLSWAGRLAAYYNQDKSDETDTLVFNIASRSYNTYFEMPTGFINPIDRPGYDSAHNVTKALSFHPDAVIINLPNNDIALGFSPTETMNNFRIMYDAVTATGARCYITTPQPRNDFNDSMRQCLLSLVDSIKNTFGAYAIDFWSDLVTDGGELLLSDSVRAIPSGFHVNDLGHYYLFQRVLNKNVTGNDLVTKLELCAPVDNTILISDSSGQICHWQVDTGNGFVNINDNAYYTGTSRDTLYLTNIPSSWTGYQYRCVYCCSIGSYHKLRFSNTWTGAVNNNWLETGNWSCGTLPEINTTVLIKSGTVFLQSNTSCRSVRLSQGASLTINEGYELTITH